MDCQSLIEPESVHRSRLIALRKLSKIPGVIIFRFASHER